MKKPVTVLVVCLLCCFVLAVNFVEVNASTVWNKEYEWQGKGEDVIKTNDEGYAIAGNAEGKIFFLKLDSSGDIQCSKTYGNGTAFSIIQTTDGGYALAGTGDDVNFVKTNSDGVIEWSKYYKKSDLSFHVQSIIQTKDKGFALTGWISNDFSMPKWDWTIKTDQYGNIQWNRTYGIQRSMSSGCKILQENDKGYVLAANGNLSRIDSQGEVIWTKNCVKASDLIKTNDGGYLVSAGNGATLVKTDQQGNQQWSQSYNYQGARWSFFYSVIQTSEENYVITGATYPVYDGLGWILKVDETGQVIGETVFPPETGINNRIFSITETGNNEYVFTGSKNAENGNGSVWFAKITSAAIPEFSSWTLLQLLFAGVIISLIAKNKLFKSAKLQTC